MWGYYEKLNKIFFAIGIVIFVFINISLINRYGDISYRGNIRFEFNRGILFASSCLVFIVLLKTADSMKQIILDQKAGFLFLAIASMLHFTILLVIGNELADIPAGNWDEGFCFYNALRLINGEPVTDYFIAYPQGIGTFAVDYFVISAGKRLGFTEVMQYSRMLVFVSAAAIEGTILCCVAAVRNMCRGNEAFVEFSAMLISYLFIPYYVYAVLFYSDTYSLVFTALVIKKYTDYCTKQVGQKRKAVYILEIVLFAFVGAKVKATVGILLIAILINELVRKNYRFVGMSIGIYIVLSVIFSSFLYVMNDKVPTRETDEYYKYPYTLYLQYGTQGDYGDLDPDIHINMLQSIDEIGIEKTKEKQVKEILNTIASRTLSEHLDFYMGKADRLWGDGMYLLDLEVVSIGDDANHCFLQTALYESGFIRNVLFYFTQGFQYSMVFLILIGTVICYKKGMDKTELSAFILALMGVTVFLVIFWENRSRYLFNMFPLICVSSSMVLYEIVNKDGRWAVFRKR